MSPVYGIGKHGRFSAAHTDARRPTVALAETFSRDRSMSNAAVLNTGRENVAALQEILPAGTVISSITHFSATTPGSGMTHQWMSLRDSSLNLLAVTANDVATAWSANSAKTLFLSRVVTDGVATSGSAVVTSATAAFTAADVGKNITFVGAGAAGAVLGSSASGVTIVSVDSATQITVSASAGTTVASGGTLYIATPYTITTASQPLYVGLCVVGTVPTLQAVTLTVSTPMSLAPVLAGLDNTHALTTPATANSPIVLSGATQTYAYAYVS